MPKSPSRFNKRWSSPQGTSSSCCPQPSQSSSSPASSSGSFGSTTPRKVSFEDGNHSDSDSSLPAASFVATSGGSSGTQQQQQDHPSESPSCATLTPLRRKRSMLVRPTTSLSLVDLANQMDDEAEDQEEQRHQQPMEEDRSREEQRKAKRVCSPQASPHSSIGFPATYHPPTGLVRSSPWGHFVDTVPEEEEGINLASPAPTATSTPRPYFFGDAGVSSTSSRSSVSSSSHHDHTGTCCTSCRIRRASPFGDYSKSRRRGQHHEKNRSASTSSPLAPPSLTFLQLQESFMIPSSSSSSSSTTTSISAAPDGTPKFRLSPRKQMNSSTRNFRTISSSNTFEPTVQLISAFSGLQVRQEETSLHGLFDSTNH